MNRLYIRSLLLVSVIALSTFCTAQNVAPADQVIANTAKPKPQGLCKFADVSKGNHKSVRVAAVAEAGTDMGVLSYPGCPSRQPVWFELALRSRRNRTELATQIERSGKAAVILSGELYGPPEADPKLQIRYARITTRDGDTLAHSDEVGGIFRIESVALAGKPYNER